MKVTFVYPDLYVGWEGKWSGQFYRGIAILSAVLKRAGHETSLIHVYDHPDREEFLTRVRRESPGLIAFSTTSHMFPLVRTMSSWIRETGSKVPIICGGVHPTLAPEQTIAYPAIDMICVGEGEDALLEVCAALSAGMECRGIANIWTKENGTVQRSSCRPLIRNLDELPFADTELFDYENLALERQGYACFAVSRGCPYNCSYCCNHALKAAYRDLSGYVRRRSVDSVISEVETVLGKYPFVDKVVFDDDILFDDKEWAREFTLKYRTRIGLPFECQERVNHIDEEMAALLKEAGCVKVKIGLESGNEFIRREVLKRAISQETIRNAVVQLKRQGISVSTYNILGIPSESAAQILETIKMNAEMEVDYIQHTVFYPYAGTALYELCLEKGFLTDKANYSYFGNSVLKLDTVTSDQIDLFHRYYEHIFRFYRLGHRNSIFNALLKPADAFFVSDIWPIFGKHVLNPLHTFYRRYLKPWLRRRGSAAPLRTSCEDA